MGLQKGKIVISLRSLELYSSKRPFLDFIGEIVTYLINRLPSRVLESVSLVQLITTFYPSIPIMTSLQSVSLVVLLFSMFIVLIVVS